MNFKVFQSVVKRSIIDNVGESSSQWWIQNFPEEGAPTLRGAPTYDFMKFSQKLHEIERLWAPRGERVPRTPPLPLDPPLYLSDEDMIS